MRTPVDAKERQRARFLALAFNITPVEWERIAAHQHGVCFVCNKKPVGKRLATDHCHATGLLRGLLCHRCNALLGKLENNFKRYGLHKVPGLTPIYVLEKLAVYLAHPPASIALERHVHGYPGKIGTKVYRKWAKKQRATVLTLLMEPHDNDN
jgi:hypothetical protein